MIELNANENPCFVGIKMADTTRSEFNDSATAKDFHELATQPLPAVLHWPKFGLASGYGG
jgi:hypothetical protein